MPFGLRTLVGLGNYVLDGSPYPPQEGAIFRGGGMGRSIVEYRDTLRTSVQKTAKPIEMPFGFWTQMGTKNRV